MGTITACSSGEGTLVVHVPGPVGTPLAGVEVTALPVNPDALLDSLAGAARRPQPRFPALEAEMAAFRSAGMVDTARVWSARAAWEATRDSVEALADTLATLERVSVAYREAYGRLRSLYDRLGQRAAQRDRELQAGFQTERSLAERAGRAADSLRRWEDAAYANFPQRLALAVRHSGRDLRQLSTDSTGTARFALPPGLWWIQARIRDRDNPFMERYWNASVRLTRLLPVSLPLLQRTATRRWRH